MGSAQRQAELWGPAARAWSELNEPHCAPLYETVFDAIGLAPGQHLLDVGCGAGLALQLAGKRGAITTGIDATAALVEVARERNPESDLRVGEIEELPYPDASFDAVTSFNAVQYAEDATAALAGMARVAKPGAPIAVLAWGRADQCETAVILAALGRLLPPPPPGAAPGGPFALAEPGRLEELLDSADLTVDRTGDAHMAFEFPDLDTAIAAQLTSGPARAAIDHAGETAVREALADAYTVNRQPDGSYRQANVFRYAIGHR